MKVKFIGNDGEYVVKNSSSIMQFKLDKDGNHTGESIIHSITDTIENNEDRKEISKKIENLLIA